MSQPPADNRRNHNIWAPWRSEYIGSLGSGDNGCFLCHHRDDQAHDAANYVLWRGERTFAMLNLFPYTGGHAMVAPYEHVAGLADLDTPTMLETMRMLRDLQRVLAEALGAQGFNVGVNLGRCAGAGMPGHLHFHIVPRWPGDTNFMGVLGGIRVIPTSPDEVYRQVIEAAARLHLPQLDQ